MSSAADVVIVGAGIAGCEAAWRCAVDGLDVVLVTTSLDTVYNLAADAVGLQAPAGSLMDSVLGADPVSRDLVGSWALHRAAKYALEAQPRIHLVQSTVSAVLLDERGSAAGVRTWEGVDRTGDQTALCVGSFLQARLTSGAVTETHGRLSEMAYDDLYDWLATYGFGFVPVRFESEPASGSLPYVVDTVALAADERQDEGRSAARLWRVPGLWAAGVCVAPPPSTGTGASELRYADVARQGVELGVALVARSGR